VWQDLNILLDDSEGLDSNVSANVDV
jgi:hypothetical protein